MFTVCHINDLLKDDHEGLPALDRYVLGFLEYWDAPADESRQSTDGKITVRFFRACCEQIILRDRSLSRKDRKRLDRCAAIILVRDNVLYFDRDEKACEAWEELEGMC